MNKDWSEFRKAFRNIVRKWNIPKSTKKKVEEIIKIFNFSGVAVPDYLDVEQDRTVILTWISQEGIFELCINKNDVYASIYTEDIEPFKELMSDPKVLFFDTIDYPVDEIEEFPDDINPKIYESNENSR